MKRMIRALSAMLVLALLVLTACDGGVESQASVDESTEQVMSSKAESIEDEIVELENKDLIWMAWWTLDVGTPEVDAFKTLYDGNIINWQTTYDARYDDLGNKIMSGDSPDIFPFETANFPNGIVKEMFEPIDDVIDLESDLWADTKSMLDNYTWGGKHYVVSAYIAPDMVLIYNKDTIEENGFDDPYELFVSGEWTWDAMEDMMMDFVELGEGYYGVNDYKVIVPSVVSTSGVPMIGIEGDQLTNNLRAPEVERAQNFLLDMSKNALNISDGDHIADIAAGKLLFYVGQFWGDVKDNFTPVAKQNLADSVWFVPFPRDPDSDTYYHLYNVDAHMLVKNAPNPEGFAAWSTCRRLVKIDEELTQMDAEMCLEKYNLPLDLYYYFMELCNPGDFGITPVADYTSGVSLSLKARDALSYSAFRDGLTWSETRETYFNDVQDKIDTINSAS